jgi:hypothetical protein
MRAFLETFRDGFEMRDAFSDRFEMLFEDPLGRGHVFRIEVATSPGSSESRYFLFNITAGEFVKFSGFSETGKYMGFSKTLAANSSDRLRAPESVETYAKCASEYRELYKEAWACIVSSAPAVNCVEQSCIIDDDWLAMHEAVSASARKQSLMKDTALDLYRQALMHGTWESFTAHNIALSMGRVVTLAEKHEIGECMMWLLEKL